LKWLVPLMEPGELTLIRTYGNRSDEFAPYAELYHRRPSGGTAGGLGPHSGDGTIPSRSSDPLPDPKETPP
jgi:hypothetical protein